MGTPLNRLGEAVLTCTIIGVLSKNKKNLYKKKSIQNFQFLQLKKDICTLHGRAFVINANAALQ